MQQDMKIIVFEIVEWICDFELGTTLLVQELQLFSSFSRGALLRNSLITFYL